MSTLEGQEGRGRRERQEVQRDNRITLDVIRSPLNKLLRRHMVILLVARLAAFSTAAASTGKTYRQS